jgi:hypothetical protein
VEHLTISLAVAIAVLWLRSTLKRRLAWCRVDLQLTFQRSATNEAAGNHASYSGPERSWNSVQRSADDTTGIERVLLALTGSWHIVQSSQFCSIVESPTRAVAVALVTAKDARWLEVSALPFMLLLPLLLLPGWSDCNRQAHPAKRRFTAAAYAAELAPASMSRRVAVTRVGNGHTDLMKVARQSHRCHARRPGSPASASTVWEASIFDLILEAVRSMRAASIAAPKPLSIYNQRRRGQ